MVLMLIPSSGSCLVFHLGVFCISARGLWGGKEERGVKLHEY